MADYDLVCPFLTDDPTFAEGVEFGLLYARMRDESEVADYFTRRNQERILLLANRLGWAVLSVEPFDRHWFWCEMEKGPPPAG